MARSDASCENNSTKDNTMLNVQNIRRGLIRLFCLVMIFVVAKGWWWCFLNMPYPEEPYQTITFTDGRRIKVKRSNIHSDNWFARDTGYWISGTWYSIDEIKTISKPQHKSR
ncbi:MAG: hypothetical protein KAS32_25585 [Candidatus Peribacteraceae bacterium]|nr:hypothetical protein [Candidatus Peribacteraceae bacterium]